MRADDPASALRSAAEHIAVVAKSLLQLRMHHEAVDADALRIEIRPSARRHSDTRRGAVAGDAFREISRKLLRPQTAVCKGAAKRAPEMRRQSRARRVQLAMP